MENLPGNLEKVVKSLSLPKQSKRFDSWILLAIGDHGKTISIGRLKGLVVALVLAVVIVAVSVSYLLIIAKSASKENEGLQSALDASKKQVTALRDEKDILMVRLVLAESGVKDKLAGTGEEQTGETSGGLPDKSASVETEPGPDDIEKTVFSDNEKQPAEKPAEKPTDPEPEKLLSAAIEDFKVSFEPHSSDLKVQFKIINTSGDSQPVSGHAFVILQDDGIDQDRWLTFPLAMLVSGKPSQYNKGQYFSIYRFKTVRFNAQNETNPKRFKNAIVLVYSVEGDLLLKKSCPVKITGVVEDTLE